MNRLLKASIALTAFTIAIGIFQMCSKENVIAQAASYILPIATTTTLGGVKPDGTTITVDGTGKISSTGSRQQGKIIYSVFTGISNFISEVWIVNFDGTNKVQVPLTNLPSNIEFSYPAKISPDGQTIFLIGHVPASSPAVYQIYSMSATGSSVTKIVEASGPSLNDIVISDLQTF